MASGDKAGRSLVVGSRLLAIVLLVWLIAASAAPARSGTPGRTSSALRVAVAYIAALDRHDAAGVCSLFAPQLRAFEGKWDAPTGGQRSCRQAVRAHFHSYYSPHRWAEARIRGRSVVSIDPRTGMAAVRMVLVHRYICAGEAPQPEPCRPTTYRRLDLIYLTERAGHWLVIKPGLVYRASEIDSPNSADESFYYPPATPATVMGSVEAPPRDPLCPAAVTAVTGPHTLQSTFAPNPRGHPGSAPWLLIKALGVARLSPQTVCFTLALAGVPRPDSDYSISIGTTQDDAPANRFDVDFDGLGHPHPLLAGIGVLSNARLAAELPHVYLNGARLQIIATEPFFARNRNFLVLSTSQSTQSDEPLLARPLDAGDLSPHAACLTFPTGTLDRNGLCGSSPSG